MPVGQWITFEGMHQLLDDIRACQICLQHLPHGTRPVLQASARSRVLIIGQAPGARVHASGIPWADASGNTLRAWLGVNNEAFYDPERFALMPMGFCYPGSGKSGDLPPRPECAPAWHRLLLASLPGVRLTLLVGQYAQGHYLGERGRGTLTDNVRTWREFLPDRLLPLPHPSPRNRIWLRKNPWFETELLPMLKEQVAQSLSG